MLRLFLVLLFCMLIPGTASAEWTAHLPAHTPEYLLAADKSRNILFQVERSGTSSTVTRQFNCIHGRREGDKQKEGDLRTPEGVYFITHKITQKLDFMEYGPHAFNLNYPNPADRLRGKTGSGIWLHSKGQPIDGLTTRGCMAIDQYELTDLLPVLIPGTPVVIAEHLEGSPFPSPQLPSAQNGPAAVPADPLLPARNTLSLPQTPPPSLPVPTNAGTAYLQSGTSAPTDVSASSGDDEKVLRQTLFWMDSRQQQSESIFSIYDRENYPQASREKFSALQKRIRSDFKRQEDLFLDRDGIRILEGPGYWVSCFIKSYLRKGEYHHGLQALYWIPDAAGEYHIIGEVWIKN